MNLTARMVSEMLKNLRRDEESNLPSGSLVCTIAKGYKYGLLITAIFGIGMGYFLSVPIHDPQIGMLFGILGIVALLMLPTYFSYRCRIDKGVIKAEYFVLIFRIRKEILWKDVAYKKIKRDSKGYALSIRLYNSNKKKLIAFDYSIVGFGKIVKMAKRIPYK